MSISFISIFLLTVLIASIIPGPSMLLALNHGVRFGRRHALRTAAGNVFATLVQALLAFAGLGVILIKAGFIFTIVKYCGAAYLAYLGIRIFFSRSGIFDDTEHSVQSKHSLFMEAFLVTIGNPKAILFFTALFPQFIDSPTLPVSTAAFMLASILVITFACMMLYATAGETFRNFLRSRKRARQFNRIVGLSFVGISLRMAFDRR
jgi:threonine/homoserine/homoserine lactone efflux protein